MNVVYSLWNGRLTYYEGQMQPTLHPSADTAIFEAKLHKNGGLRCSIYPGKVYNAIVWLTNRDDKMAIELLIDYQQMQITILEEKIKNHEQKVLLLKGAI